MEVKYIPEEFDPSGKQEVLVIRADEPGMLRALNFFEKLGLKFHQEQHGKGPLHWACTNEQGSAVLEIYPQR